MHTCHMPIFIQQKKIFIWNLLYFSPSRNSPTTVRGGLGGCTFCFRSIFLMRIIINADLCENLSLYPLPACYLHRRSGGDDAHVCLKLTRFAFPSLPYKNTYGNSPRLRFKFQQLMTNAVCCFVVTTPAAEDMCARKQEIHFSFIYSPIMFCISSPTPPALSSYIYVKISNGKKKNQWQKTNTMRTYLYFPFIALPS